MGAKGLLILLDPTSTGFYLPGQCVSGVVALDSRNVSYKDLYVKVVGYAKVGWSWGRSTHSAIEYYLNRKIPLAKENSILDQATDRRCLMFSFTLPSEIPSSYEGRYGHIRYSLKSVMKRRSFFRRDSVSQINIYVKNMVDLQRDSMVSLRESRYWAKRPASVNGSVKVTAELDRSGYLPGETIQFNAKIENSGIGSVKKTSIQFIQYTILTDKLLYCKKQKLLWEQKNRKIEANRIQIWDNLPIPVPTFIPPTGLPFCNLMKIYYVIKVVINPGIFCQNLVIPMSVTIGNTRSLIDNQRILNSQDESQNMSSSVNSYSPGAELPISNNSSSWVEENFPVDSPPPTYEDCELNGYAFPSFFTEKAKIC